MRKNEQQNITIAIIFGLITFLGVLAYLFIKGDAEIVIIRTNANIENEFVDNYINASDSKYGDKFIEDSTKEGKSVIFFSSKWCGICNAFKNSFYVEFEEKAQTKINLIEADININSLSSQKFEVGDVPTVVFIEDGVVIKKYENFKLDQIPAIVAEVLEN
ncbi:MAG: hypothetical protein KatS3mg086_105 [Candidatus Dojkabacteria bacterium]|nr:MAG: hypothetical protein KatS3mg086_105 [Candidatus Dojkabacteria bacterium]